MRGFQCALLTILKIKQMVFLPLAGVLTAEGAGGEDDGCDKHFAGGRLGARRGTSDSDWQEFRDPRGSLALTGKPCGRRGRK